MRLLLLIAPLVAGKALAADISGDWKIESNLGDTPINVNCTLVQAEHELTGTCTPVMENAETSELAGIVDGATAEWSYDIVFNGNPGHVAFEAAIDSDAKMSGTLLLSGTPTKFTATKQESH